MLENILTIIRLKISFPLLYSLTFHFIEQVTVAPYRRVTYPYAGHLSTVVRIFFLFLDLDFVSN